MAESVKPELSWDEYKKKHYPKGVRPEKRPTRREEDAEDVRVSRSRKDEPGIPIAQSGRSRHTAGDMNKLEARYASHLELRKLAGEIVDWRYEPINLCLAKATYLKIDFLVLLHDNVVELHETKGRWEDDARAKIKMAAQLFPWWTIYGVKWDKEKKDWKYERIARRGENNGR